MTTKRPTTLPRTVIRPTGAGSWANKETLFAHVPIRGDIETGRRQTVLALSNENRHKHTSNPFAVHSGPALPLPRLRSTDAEKSAVTEFDKSRQICGTVLFYSSKPS